MFGAKISQLAIRKIRKTRISAHHLASTADADSMTVKLSSGAIAKDALSRCRLLPMTWRDRRAAIG